MSKQKIESSFKKHSKPFILVSTKAKFKFVSGIVKEIEIALEKSGKKFSLTNKLNMQNNLLKMVGVMKDE